MKNAAQSPPIREAVGIFFDTKKLEDAIEDLKSSGFHNEEFSLLANDLAVKEKLGRLYTGINKEADNPDAPLTDFIAKESVGDAFHALFGTLFFIGTAITCGVVVALAGVYRSTLVMAVASLAVLISIGAVIAAIIHQSDSEYLEMQVDHDRLLLFVRTCDKAHEKQAMEILSKYSAYDPKIYSVPSYCLIAA